MGLPLHIVRLVVLAAVSLFGLVALAMGGALAGGDTDIAPYSALAIATGVLTLVTLLPMIALEIIRPGGPTSMIIVEIAWLSILAVLWLATGAETAAVLQAVSDFGLGFGICDSDNSLSEFIGSSAASQIGAGCSETKAIAAFGFLNWLLLTFYVVVILILGIMASSRKQAGVWTSSVAGMQSGGAGPAEKHSVPHGQSYAAYPPVMEPHSTGTGGTVQAGTVHSHV